MQWTAAAQTKEIRIQAVAACISGDGSDSKVMMDWQQEVEVQGNDLSYLWNRM
jgi:hypothetical protein